MRRIALTNKEREYLTWKALGKTSHEISIIMGRSKNTVESQMRQITYKLNATNICHAIYLAMENGLLDENRTSVDC